MLHINYICPWRCSSSRLFISLKYSSHEKSFMDCRHSTKKIIWNQPSVLQNRVSWIIYYYLRSSVDFDVSLLRTCLLTLSYIPIYFIVRSSTIPHILLTLKLFISCSFQISKYYNHILSRINQPSFYTYIFLSLPIVQYYNTSFLLK